MAQTSGTNSTNPTISVVVPVYGCAGCLEELCSQVEANVSRVTDRYEVVLVDDRSPDGSWATIGALMEKHPFLRAIRLSRNYGQHIAITAGLARARGDFVVVMDCDLQDPPRLIPLLYETLSQGYDLVLARRAERSHSAFRRFAARAYFRMLSRIANERIDGSYGTFSILSRKVVDAFLRFEEKERHFLFILRWLGFRMGTIEYEQAARYSGRSSYTLSRLIAHAIDGILFQTTTLLRWIVSLGLVFAAIGLLLAGYLAWHAFFQTALPGWTSLAVLVLVCTGTILFSLGVTGVYVGKIFEQAKQRPLYVVDVIAEENVKW